MECEAVAFPPDRVERGEASAMTTGLMDALDSIRGARSGLQDPMDELEEREFVAYLLYRLGTWAVRFGKSMRYDEAVRAAVIEGILEWAAMASAQLRCKKCCISKAQGEM